MMGGEKYRPSGRKIPLYGSILLVKTFLLPDQGSNLNGPYPSQLQEPVIMELN